MPIACFFIALVAYGNLRGVKESGKVFAVPTYFFIFNMAILLGIGLYKWIGGDLHHVAGRAEGQRDRRRPRQGHGFLYGAGIFGVLHAFASGGAAVTGVEAISNGVPAFREPAWKNARQTLVVMGIGLGIMFLGLSVLAAALHVGPVRGRHPHRDLAGGRGRLRQRRRSATVLFYSLQAGTMLILVMAANTGFADFPRLASFQAGDSFLPASSRSAATGSSTPTASSCWRAWRCSW